MEFAGDTATIAGARHEMAQWLGDHGVYDETVIADASLVMSELCSNAVEAAPGHPYRVEIQSVGRTRCRVAVTSWSDPDDLPDRSAWGPDEVLAERGRGLAIVDALAETVSLVRAEADAVAVVAILRLPVRE